jgi:hypothetical protein
MSAGKYTYFIEQGTTSELFIKYKDQNGNPISLVGYSAQLQFRPNYADFTQDKYLTLSSSMDPDGSGISMVPESGSLVVCISAEKTDTFNFDDAYYDLEIYSGSYTKRLLEGRVKISKSVTR